MNAELILVDEIFDLESKSKLPRAKCLLYEPLSDSEGTCCSDNSTVNISGCESPENCNRYKNYQKLKRY